MVEKPPPNTSWRRKLYIIIFEADTPGGKTFDVFLLWAILLSVAVVMLESVREIDERYGAILHTLEVIFTLIFTAEYIARIFVVDKPVKYIFSFLGIVDFLAIIPTYISYLAGSQYLLVIRTIRLLRVFRIFKLKRFTGEADTLVRALHASRHKITVFLLSVLSLVFIMGTLMYLIEGEENGFTSIPLSIYWAIITLTTVGYGDIAPLTVVGRALASIIMIIGYSIIAVPTGILTAELTRAKKNNELLSRVCPNCGSIGHAKHAVYCNICATPL
ncbi:ion transporter [soil metagenome]